MHSRRICKVGTLSLRLRSDRVKKNFTLNEKKTAKQYELIAYIGADCFPRTLMSGLLSFP
jgi:hypothetical protein